MVDSQPLTGAQQELYDWLADYIGSHRHSPSIRQMMEAMGLRSPAPIQSRLRHLQQKGWITWQEGQARTLQLLGGLTSGIPVLGAVAAGGLIDTYDDVQERLDLDDCLSAFSEKEVLDESNPWLCPVCRKHQCASKTLTIWRFPDFLIIYLKR